jgi:hypothetical protein
MAKKGKKIFITVAVVDFDQLCWEVLCLWNFFLFPRLKIFTGNKFSTNEEVITVAEEYLAAERIFIWEGDEEAVVSWSTAFIFYGDYEDVNDVVRMGNKHYLFHEICFFK